MSEPKHTNRLARETSPYLLQHAHNPVDWFPWGEEALAKAKAEDLPILLSIGYSACHWCHVMERESFEDEETAALMNKLFVNIKVDREERPDLDEIYMAAVQALTQHGGWPMTVFLTPELEPFHGGTYFPPVDRHGMPSFRRVLVSVTEFYRQQRDKVTENAKQITQFIRTLSEVSADRDRQPSVAWLDRTLEHLVHHYDGQNGGFGGAPKFPHSMDLSLLLRVGVRTGNTQQLDIVTHSLDQMAGGGLMDQIGGGFHRYSVDAKWLVPHFEKMLYDNGLLARVYLEAWQATGDVRYRRIVESTLDYLRREMTDERGGIYSTQDADSEGVEGKFFVWKPEEIDAVLGEELGAITRRYFGVTESGNFEHGTSILHVPTPIDATAKLLGLSVEELEAKIEEAKEKLYEAREQRVHPGLDDKILTAWNGLAIATFARAGRAFGEEKYLESARRAASFCLEELRDESGRLLHTWRHGKAKLPAYHDDYAFLIEGLIDLYEATFEAQWIEAAEKLTDEVSRLFADTKQGGFFYTGNDHEKLIVRTRNPYDNAVPSGNAIHASNLVRLARLLDRSDLEEQARRTFQAFEKMIERAPGGFSQMLCALDHYVSQPMEIAIAGERGDEDTQQMIREIGRRFLPTAVTALSAEDAPKLPWLEDKQPVNGKAAVYICRNFACQKPVTSLEELAKVLGDR
ncbi:MAG: thioredoxin domain-containing protein [Planctomycetota bacterium]